MTMNDLKDRLTPIVRELINNTISSLTADAKAYAEELAEDFIQCAWDIQVSDSNTAKQNLEHLKLQVKQLAIIHRIKLNDNIRKALINGLTIALSITVAML